MSFLRAWQTKPQFTVNQMDFKEIWLHARPEDLDEFTVMLLTT